MFHSTTHLPAIWLKKYKYDNSNINESNLIIILNFVYYIMGTNEELALPF